MSEKLKIGGSEKLDDSVEAGRFDTLAKMSGDFDPDKAQKLREQNRPKDTEQIKTDDKRRNGLTMAVGEQERELTPKDAANEYLALLDELSQDFTNPDYGEGRGKIPTHFDNISSELGRKYSDNPHYRWSGYAGTEADANDSTALRLALTDYILKNEIKWRNNGEYYADQIKKSNEEIANLDAEYAKKSRIGKFFAKKRYEEARQKLVQSKTRWEYNAKSSNRGIADGLATAYNEEGGGIHDAEHRRKEIGYNEELENENQNRRFFGMDDPERAKKIERALELRQKYEKRWSEDKQK